MKAAAFLPLIVGMVSLFLLSSCERKEPIKIGFIGGLSGRVADLGIGGRNGVQLAVDQSNAAGGIGGRLIELVVKDDQQNPATAKQAVNDLLSQKVELIIGPMTSAMAMAVIPQMNKARTVLLSPTVTTTELFGIDDFFVRVTATTREYAAKSARYQFQQRGARTVAAIYDRSNLAYTESWLNDFRATFEGLGGKMVDIRPFDSGRDMVFFPLVKELVAADADLVLIIANAVDAALICQQVNKLTPGQKIAMSEWASTERFIELAGKASEDVVISQFLDKTNRSQAFLEFQAAYQERFRQPIGFAALAGYDAAQVALAAINARADGESLKSTILRKSRFQGVQQEFKIDRFGDAERKVIISVIRNYHFVNLE